MEIDLQLRELFPNASEILVPKKTEAVLRKFVSKKLLKEIDSDIDIAIEKCLLVLSNLTSTLYSENKWKYLHSSILHEQTREKDNTYIYSKIIKLLEIGTKDKGPIIEVNKSYQTDNYTRQYKLTETYLNCGHTVYFIKTDKIVQRRSNTIIRQLREGMKHPIIANLLEIYDKIELPTEEQIKAEAKRLVKLGYKTKKGKTLTFLNKHSKDYWKDASERSFVEEAMDIFNFFTARGYMIPTVGSEESGGRVIDSFTLMPSWIRNLIKIDGQSMAEADYKALHPNIANKIFNGSGKHISHQEVAEKLSIDIKEAKIEHLSFFNKRKDDMKKSPLYKYYQENELTMINNILIDKTLKGYKNTSKTLFTTEVGIMLEVVKRLNTEQIYAIYVYDALYVKQTDYNITAEIMNQVVKEMKINTFVG